MEVDISVLNIWRSLICQPPLLSEIGHMFCVYSRTIGGTILRRCICGQERNWRPSFFDNSGITSCLSPPTRRRGRSLGNIKVMSSTIRYVAQVYNSVLCNERRAIHAGNEVNGSHCWTNEIYTNKQKLSAPSSRGTSTKTRTGMERFSFFFANPTETPTMIKVINNLGFHE